MANKRIAIDFDGNIADYQRNLLNFINERYNSGYKFEDIKRHDCYDILGNPLSRTIKLLSFYSHTDNLLNIPPVEFSVKSILALKREGYSLSIVTSRFKWLAKATYRWLEKHRIRDAFEFVSFSSIPSTQSNKFKPRRYKKLNLDKIIEDSSDVAMKCAENGAHVLLLDYPWNKYASHPNLIRIANWQEALEFILSSENPNHASCNSLSSHLII